MFKFLKDRKKKDNKGFTLVELVIVIAILAILVGLLAPQYTKYVEKSRKAADASNMDEMVQVIKVYAADPANELEAGDYVITMSKDKTVITAKGTELATTGELTGLAKEMNSSIPKWSETKVKSQKWGKEGVYDTIVATVKVGPDGGTSVVYSNGVTDNTKFANYMAKGSED